MIYNFSEKKDRNNMTDEKMQLLKESYQEPEMSRKQVDELKSVMKDAAMENKKNRNRRRILRLTSAAAACAALFVILPNTSAGIAYAMEQMPVIGSLAEAVTFRNYEYKSDRNMAEVEMPQINPGQIAADSEVQENLERSAEEINAEIREHTDELVEQFKANLEKEEGYQDIVVKSEVLTTTADYFTLKLICYQGAGSGTQWNYYYTIDLHTGERLLLKDLFREGADYITPISENIKEQMRERMAADDKVYYWLDDDIEEWNFKTITDETSFYVNDAGNIVIGFDEGEVAPMYMGTVEFEIPAEVTAGIRK